ncbi:MAG TPA: MBOAT family protein [Bryobacteraceae bacterium]|jgi:alginate O-acetyltransferase complex protein AlgI|nr:MBOAT family protein [Bryobacteraceae bacterium]
MLFNTPQFFAFLAIVLIAFYCSPRSWRRVILLVASYFFYMSWIPKFILLLLALTVIDYTAARWIARTESLRSRKIALIVSLSANLGLLGFFKYYNFFAANIAHLLGKPEGAFAVSIILPLGISFHTFQSMSYVIDVYRREQKPIVNPIDYALYISFFPQLVAGPIVRAREFFGDLYQWQAPNSAELLRGLLLVILGLAKKMVMADQFAQVANNYFRDVAGHPGLLAAWSGVVAFGIQIYFDFSGYTDMAIGMALLLGFHFPVNFRRPYLASSITDFWHRWHMSLSRWLRDYLYIPLGGNRHGRLMTYRNLMLTMLFGGLWHGASWNFVVWGGYHGALLSVERMFGLKRVPEVNRWTILYPIRALLTFGLVMIGWVFFRAVNFHDSIYVLGQMFTGHIGAMFLMRWQIDLALITLLLALLEEKKTWFDRIAIGPAWAYGAVCALLLLSVELLGYTEAAVPFVYFQF